MVTSTNDVESLFSHSFMISTLLLVSSLSWKKLFSDTALFWISIAIYLISRIFFLTDFPCYFHSDEAIHGFHAYNLIHNGFKDSRGVFLPLYFAVSWNFNICTSVYLQAIATAFFGSSVETIRGMTGVLSLLVPLTVALILKWHFQLRFWWVAVWYFLTMPLWLLHSRTGFEVGTYASFSSLMVFCYYQYRSGKFWWSIPLILSGTAAFYAYSAGQLVIAFTAILLGLSDLRFHIRHWKASLRLALLSALLLIPYVQFRAANPTLLALQLRNTDSYLVSNRSSEEKIHQFLQLYAQQLNPQQWFFSEDPNVRHQVDHFGPALVATLPFFVLGFFLCLWKIRDWRYRIPLILYLVAPLPSVISSPTNLRSMGMIVPLGLSTVLGFGWILSLVIPTKIPQRIFSWMLFGGLSFLSFGFIRGIFEQGCLWSTSYTLYGYQWGAPQLFAKEIPAFSASYPQHHLWLSTSWANTPEYFVAFFRLNPPIRTFGLDQVLTGEFLELDSAVLILSSEDYVRLQQSNRFTSLEILHTVLNPRGLPGFYFVKAQYIPDIKKVVFQEREADLQLLATPVTIGNQSAVVKHERLDMGNPSAWFDNDIHTLARGKTAHPFHIDLNLEQGVPCHEIEIFSFHPNLSAQVLVTLEGKSHEYHFQREQEKEGVGRYVAILPPQSYERFVFSFQIQNVMANQKANIHINEIRFHP